MRLPSRFPVNSLKEPERYRRYGCGYGGMGVEVALAGAPTL